jgi:hypothetical protein
MEQKGLQKVQNPKLDTKLEQTVYWNCSGFCNKPDRLCMRVSW